MGGSTAAKTNGHESGSKLYVPFMCTVEAVSDLTAAEKLFRLRRADGRGFNHKPGQFMQVSIAGFGEAPFSVSSSSSRGDYLELGVRKAGTLTSAMHRLRKGDAIGLRGPFGTYFDTESMKTKDLLLISGGCGLAPVRALIQYVEDKRDDYGDVKILYGAKTPDDLLYKDDLAQWEKLDRFDCRITVDAVGGRSRWDGGVGLITELIRPLRINPAATLAVVVGPPVMYRFVIDILHDKGLGDNDIIVSLERYMKCGVGKCGHCSIEHLYCCIDGPVFTLSRIAGLRGAV